MRNVLLEPSYVSQLYSEYLSHINKYHNLKRPSIFIRYLNINKQESIINTDLTSANNRFNSNGIVYDIYENTPIYYTSGVVNDIADESETTGERIVGNLSITTYTILEPNLDDIIVFPYSPLNINNEIWRVNNIRSIVNAMYSNISVRWFELTLDYAPITNIDSLNFAKHFSYLLTEEKNIPIDIYKKMILYLQKLEYILSIFKSQFNERLELYSFNNQYPLQPNYDIYKFLSINQNNFNRYFSIKSPFGILNYSNYDQTIEITNNLNYSKKIVPNINYNVDNIIDILKFNGEVNVFTVSKLLKLFSEFIDNAIRKS